MTGCVNGETSAPPHFGASAGGASGPTSLAGAATSGSGPGSGSGLGGRAIAILAPVTGPNAERGATLVNAAQLALNGTPLDVRDTGGTPQGAVAAAQAAIAAGAGVLIGPLTGAETQAVAPIARAAKIPVLAFTNDSSVGGNDVWALGVTPAQQVRRLVTASVAQGKSRFAAVLPDSVFGHAMAQALTNATSSAGVASPDIHFHTDSNASIAAAMKDVSGFSSRRGPLDDEIQAARARHDKAAVAALRARGVGAAPFDALLLADTGDRLAYLSTFLEYYDIGSSNARLLGPALWAEPATHAGAQIDGAWYAAPDPTARAAFDAAYSAKTGAPAPGLADLAYDAASIAKTAAPDGFSSGSLTRPDGFTGADGVIALRPDGSVRRGLAVFEIGADGAKIVEPAPTTASDPAS